MNENSTHSLNTFSSTWTGKTKHMSKLFWKSVVRLIPKVKPYKISPTPPENEHPYCTAKTHLWSRISGSQTEAPGAGYKGNDVVIEITVVVPSGHLSYGNIPYYM